jgi:hypothetical protein
MVEFSTIIKEICRPKKMVLGEKAGDKSMERTIIPGQEAI